MAKPKKRQVAPVLRTPPLPSAAAEADVTTTMTLRVRRSTAEAIADAAKAQGLTMKQVICTALLQAGVAIADVDLQDRTPRRHP